MNPVVSLSIGGLHTNTYDADHDGYSLFSLLSLGLNPLSIVLIDCAF